MRILADRHHQSLTESLVLLFEKRLNHELFFQKGMEWFPDWFQVYPHINTAKQYLERELEGFRGITLEDFKNTQFDILIASIPQHIEPFKKLIQLYQPQAKLIYQVGNQWDVNPDEVRNVMASAKIKIPSNINGVIYHQMFDLDIFYYGEPKLSKNVYSFINCLNTADLFKEDWEFFLELERLLPDWNFKSFGGQTRDGVMNGNDEISNKMREAFFVLHLKSGGDGFGHNLWNTAFVGRPMITRLLDYKGKLGEVLLIDGETCLTVDDKDPEEIANLLKLLYNNPTLYEEMCRNIYKVAKKNCNFDEEFKEIQIFLSRLQ